MLSRLAVLFSFLLCAQHIAAQIRIDTTHFGSPDTILVRRFEGDKLKYESFKLQPGGLVKTRQYYYADTVFGYTEIRIDFTTSYWFEFYPDSTRRIVATLVDEKLEGTYRKFYPDGTLWCEYVYKKGKQVGEQKEYHRNGRLSSAYTCVNGKAEGQFIHYDEAGTLREVSYRFMGAYNDTARFYHANGTLAYEIWYVSGRFFEIVSSYSADGKEREKGTLRNKRGTIYRYNEEGKLECIERYIHGRLRNTERVSP